MFLGLIEYFTAFSFALGSPTTNCMANKQPTTAADANIFNFVWSKIIQLNTRKRMLSANCAVIVVITRRHAVLF